MSEAVKKEVLAEIGRGQVKFLNKNGLNHLSLQQHWIPAVRDKIRLCLETDRMFRDGQVLTSKAVPRNQDGLDRPWKFPLNLHIICI
jgi:hypothetical protein